MHHLAPICSPPRWPSAHGLVPWGKRRRMGGFVLFHTVPGEDHSPAQAAAMAAFARMGMSSPRLVQGANFLLAVYPKRQAGEPSVQQFANGDFVCTCGTLIYENLIG